MFAFLDSHYILIFLCTDSAFFRMQSSAPVGASKRSGSYQSQSGGLGNSKALFSYEELVKATNGFSQENLLGEGGFGCVYKGILPDGRVVAVKQLKIGGGQGDREFKAEVETLSRIHHRHLVSIVGHCISGDRRLLIYDYVSNNDLYFHLHGKEKASPRLHFIYIHTPLGLTLSTCLLNRRKICSRLGNTC